MKDEELMADAFISSLEDSQICLLADWCNIKDGLYDGETAECSAELRADLCNLGYEKLGEVVVWALYQQPFSKDLLRLNGLWQEANA